MRCCKQKITSLLGDQKPQVTFTCDKEDATCQFQFWVDQRESFYCDLDQCKSSAEFDEHQNSTSYVCDNIKCSCISDRMLCGQDGSVDISDFLKESIRGPAKFECQQDEGKSNDCQFREPQMDDLISALIGDSSILLTCRSGECLYHTEVPGYERPVKRINTPLIAGIIALCSLFLVAVILLTWYLSRRQFKYGPIHLDDSDDENAKLMADHKPASLYFRDISYALNGKQILKEIGGLARPGEITAIMGASGAGKTTFLDILARKNKRGRVAGDFYVNGEKISDSDYKSFIGFVDQEDTMLPTLTVHETILTSALLRLPRNMSRAAKEQRVVEVEKQLGIHHIRDSLIGSEEGKGRGISGGEKRRVGIACELVTSPSILFLDEPTSGLDAYNAYNVIECLVTLAKTYNRTVIFTIHQPRSNIVALFDRLILLARGNTVYSGPFHQCQDYFDSIGYSCPPGFNIADYLVDLTMHAGSVDDVDDGTIFADNSSVGPSSTRAVKSIGTASIVSTNDDGNNLPPTPSRPKGRRHDSVRKQQERELFTRRRQPVDTAASSDAGLEDPGSFRLHRQSPHDDPHDLPPAALPLTALDEIVQAFAESGIADSTRDEISQSIEAACLANGANATENSAHSSGINVGAMAVLSGYLFYGITDDIAGFQNRLGFERLLFVRERANGYYLPVTYFAAKVLFDIVPLRIIPPLLMGSIIYPMTGLVADFEHFYKFILILILFNLAAAAICLFIGIVCKDHGVANLIGSLVMLFSLLFAGLLLNHNAIPKTAVWLQSLSIFHYAFESLIVNEVVHLTLVDNKYGINITVPGAAILSSFGFDNNALWSDVFCLGTFAVLFIILAYTAMHILLVERR
ncbi:unnamed protein product [Parascedosporium putredinis]|uniref:ABC transporter domain-containing protein n=1 Tax=Parascedosporium putredinis TaxID=1442378 RepID=A0A9P1H258_9PEZI|nr:unnamed protein product [Parascedosporium putredinis]CAI7994303.1 unnamed protein product [Parascedosporium putredinis]